MDEDNTKKSEESTENAIPEEEVVPTEGMTENEIVVLILIITLIGVAAFGFYVYSNRRYYGIGISAGPRVNARDLSKERDAYYKTKATLDVSDPAQLEELKKALMRRAMFTIPMILNLQQQGKSVDRLYGRGMLTDEIMDNVKNLKAFVDAEFPDVQAEADDIIHGWGPAIWQEAMQFHRMVQQHHTAEQNKGGEVGPTPAGSGPLNRDAKDRKSAAAERRRKNAASLQLSPAELLKKKEAEAERMAAQLLKEEENAKSKKKK